MYTHVELRSNVPTYQKPEPHQTMLIQLVQNHDNHIAMTTQLSRQQVKIACLLVHTVIRGILSNSLPEFKPGQVIWFIRVNQVTFCPGQADLTRFIKNPGLPQILLGSRALMIASVPDQSNKLSVLDGDDGSVYPMIFFTIF